ncbi:AMP-binding protein [Sneathiella sp.]|uniref:AMP-binding protein n=1 Tax=Sneathiella sp. TaxID=1964365 RepID=UPI003569EC74
MPFLPLSRLMTSPRENDLIVAISKGKTLNFAQFRTDVADTATRVQAEGVEAVVLATTSSYFYCVGLLGAFQSGCRVIVPPNSLPGMLNHFVTAACPLLSDNSADVREHQLLLRHSSGVTFEFTELNPEDCHLDFYTSGSSGDPKRVAKSLCQIENELAVLHTAWGDQLDSAPTLGTVTHQHIFGQIFKTLLPLCEGRLFFPETFEIWEDMLAVAPPGSCFVSSPAHLSRIPPFDPLLAEQQPKIIFSAGGPLGMEASHHAATIFGPLTTEIYGSTETGAVASRQQDTREKAFRPLDGMETRVDAAGRLSVKSSYTDNADWFETNDIAERFDNGSFLLTARANQFIKIEGKRVSLAEVEKYLCGSELVRDAVTLVLKDARGSLGAVVELTEKGWQQHGEIGAFRLSRRLRQQLQSNLENAAMPRRWRFVERLPVNTQGKRLQQDLHQLFTA